MYCVVVSNGFSVLVVGLEVNLCQHPITFVHPYWLTVACFIAIYGIHILMNCV